jgi:protein-S-isoprenylcysteine O-methyltransferase Ste14
MTPEIAMYSAWGLWLLSWLAAARWANASINTAGFGREIPYRVLQLASFAPLFTFAGWSLGQPGSFSFALYDPLWVLPVWAGRLMVAVGIAAFAFCWWARLHLGRLWSGTVTQKEGHRVVDTGPYAVARHPIYTGALAAAMATAAIKATPLSVWGVALIASAFVLKARLEEKFLGEELGAEAYASYRRRVPMLIPFAPV